MVCEKCGKEAEAGGKFCSACGNANARAGSTAQAAAGGMRASAQKTAISGFGWFVAVLKKYVTFKGRARRAEFWNYCLFFMIIAFALALIESLIGLGGILSGLYILATFLPSLAVSIRRMHDTGHSGWWIIVPIAGLVFCFQKGTRGENKYGSDSK